MMITCREFEKNGEAVVIAYPDVCLDRKMKDTKNLSQDSLYLCSVLPTYKSEALLFESAQQLLQ
jgi:hypothetical protein